MRVFTQYWKNETWLASTSAKLDHAASNLFRERKVGRGDRIYIVTVLAGRLYVRGWLEVDAILSQRQAQLRLKDTSLWEATDHAIAKRWHRSSTDRILSMKDVRRLVRPDGSRPVIRNGAVDGQTFRGVQEFTAELRSY